MIAKPNHSNISPKKFGQDIILNKPPLGIEYPFLFSLSFISLLSLIILIKSPAKKTIKPVINKVIERFLKSMTVKKYPFNKPLTRLKQKAEQAINKGIFFPLVLILNGKIIVLLK